MNEKVNMEDPARILANYLHYAMPDLNKDEMIDELEIAFEIMADRIIYVIEQRKD